MKKIVIGACLTLVLSAGNAMAIDLHGNTLAGLFDLLDSDNNYYLDITEAGSPLSGGLNLVFSKLDDDEDGRIFELEFYAFARAN